MKKKFFSMKLTSACALSLLVLFSSSCTDKDNLYDPNWERPHCEFTFDTDGEYTLDVSYQNMGVSTSVFFEVYDRNPVSEGEDGTVIKKEGLLPLFGGYTEFDGTYRGNLTLPLYLKEVYIYTPAFYAQRVMKATVTGNSIVATDEASRSRAFSRAGSTDKEYTSQTLNGAVVSGEKWKTYLGEFDESTGSVTGFYEKGKEIVRYEVKRVNTIDCSLSRNYNGRYYIDPETNNKVYVTEFYDKNGNLNKNGFYYDRKIAITETGEDIFHPGYNYQGTDLLVSNYKELYAVHASVINTGKDCPELYRSSADLLVGKEAEVAITLLGGNTCWNSSLGYYWYPDGQAPTSYDQIKDKVVMLFPNTQDGSWRGSASAAGYEGADRGTCIQLKYYSDINDPSTESVKFPAKTRIGFVLATNAWTNRIGNFKGDKKYRAATSSGLSQNNEGVAYNAPRTAVYKYGENIMVSFEDHTNDQNFSDVVFTLKANPVEAFEEIVDVTETEVVSIVNKGMYGFEDIWPSEGDYDMNDVILSCSYTKAMPVTKTTTTDGDGNIIDVEFSTPDKISREEYTIKTFQNFAVFTDGISCIIDLPQGVQIEEEKYYIKKRTSADFEEFQALQSLHQEDIYNKHGSLPYNQVNGGKYNIVHLVNNIRDFLGDDGAGAELKIVFTYKEGSYSKEETVFKPFICVRNKESYHEIHLPMEAPTNHMPVLGWSTQADASRPGSEREDGRGEFYIRANNMNNYLYGPWYPFAIHFSGATEEDLAPLLNKDNEARPISELYPSYEAWVESNNTEHTDWYKRPSEN